MSREGFKKMVLGIIEKKWRYATCAHEFEFWGDKRLEKERVYNKRMVEEGKITEEDLKWLGDDWLLPYQRSLFRNVWNCIKCGFICYPILRGRRKKEPERACWKCSSHLHSVNGCFGVPEDQTMIRELLKERWGIVELKAERRVG